MSLLDVNLNNLPDLKHASDGDERRLTITAAEEVAKKDDANGLTNYRIKLEDVNDPTLDDIVVYLTVSNQRLKAIDEKKWVKAAHRLATFAQCFGLNLASIDTDAMIGQTGNCILGVQNDNYGTKNTVREYVIGA